MQEPVPLADNKMGQEGDSGTIAGTLVDSHGAAVPGAKITILDEVTGRSREITTDSNGQFSVSVPPGPYEVVVALPGFQSVVRRVEVSSRGISPVSVSLSPGEQVPNVDIKPSRSAPPKKDPPGENGSSSLGVSKPTVKEIPSVRSADRTEKHPADASAVITVTVGTEVALQNWLNERAKQGAHLLSLISFGPRRSFAVFAIAPSKTDAEYLVVPVNQRPDESDLKRRIDSQINYQFVGIHRLTSNSYLMVFSRATR